MPKNAPPIRTVYSLEVPEIARDRFRVASIRQEAKGRQEYGTPLMTFNGRSPFLDLIEELNDAVTYATGFDQQYQALRTQIRRTLNRIESGLSEHRIKLDPYTQKGIDELYDMLAATDTAADPVQYP